MVEVKDGIYTIAWDTSLPTPTMASYWSMLLESFTDSLRRRTLFFPLLDGSITINAVYYNVWFGFEDFLRFCKLFPSAKKFLSGGSENKIERRKRFLHFPSNKETICLYMNDFFLYKVENCNINHRLCESKQ